VPHTEKSFLIFNKLGLLAKAVTNLASVKLIFALESLRVSLIPLFLSSSTPPQGVEI